MGRGQEAGTYGSREGRRLVRLGGDDGEDSRRISPDSTRMTRRQEVKTSGSGGGSSRRGPTGLTASVTARTRDGSAARCSFSGARFLNKALVVIVSCVSETMLLLQRETIRRVAFDNVVNVSETKLFFCNSH